MLSNGRHPFISFIRFFFFGAFFVLVGVGVLFAIGGAGMKAAASIGMGLGCFAALALTEWAITGRWHRWQRPKTPTPTSAGDQH